MPSSMDVNFTLGAEDLLVLLEQDWESGEDRVIPEADAMRMLKVNTEHFYPIINSRQHMAQGYASFSYALLHGFLSDDCAMASWGNAVSEKLSSYNFEAEDYNYGGCEQLISLVRFHNLNDNLKRQALAGMSGLELAHLGDLREVEARLNLVEQITNPGIPCGNPGPQPAAKPWLL